MSDLIDRQAALKELAVYIHLIDKTMGRGILTDDDCMEAAKSVLGEDELPAVQPDHNADVSKKVEGDCISRQDAIDAVEKAKMAQTPDGEIYVAKYNAEMNIQLLPTVQPDHTADISKKASISCGHENDLISRQAAIDAALEDVSDKRTHEFNAGAIRAVNRIKSLPSAQPETAKRLEK